MFTSRIQNEAFYDEGSDRPRRMCGQFRNPIIDVRSCNVFQYKAKRIRPCPATSVIQIPKAARKARLDRILGDLVLKSV